MSRAEDDTTTPPAPTVAPSSASREMMRALADRLAIPLALHRGRVDAAIERQIEALRSGRLDLYLRAHRDLVAALLDLSDAASEDEDTLGAIRSLDPELARSVQPLVEDLLIQSTRIGLRGKSATELLNGYVRHKLTCSDATCIAHRAIVGELEARGVKVPR